jgi:hypothetical protein
MTLLLIGGREAAEGRPGVGRYMAGGRRYPFQGFRETAFQRFWEFTGNEAACRLLLSAPIDSVRFCRAQYEAS